MIQNMKNVVDQLHIESRKEYSLEEVADLQLIPWALNYRTLMGLVTDGRLGWNIEDTRIVSGKRNQYFIKGNSIIRYLKHYGPILMDKARTKKHDRKSTSRTKSGA